MKGACGLFWAGGAGGQAVQGLVAACFAVRAKVRAVQVAGELSAGFEGFVAGLAAHWAPLALACDSAQNAARAVHVERSAGGGPKNLRGDLLACMQAGVRWPHLIELAGGHATARRVQAGPLALHCGLAGSCCLSRAGGSVQATARSRARAGGRRSGPTACRHQAAGVQACASHLVAGPGGPLRAVLAAVHPRMLQVQARRKRQDWAEQACWLRRQTRRTAQAVRAGRKSRCLPQTQAWLHLSAGLPRKAGRQAQAVRAVLALRTLRAWCLQR